MILLKRGNFKTWWFICCPYIKVGVIIFGGKENDIIIACGEMLPNIDVSLEIFQDRYTHVFSASSLCLHIPDLTFPTLPLPLTLVLPHDWSSWGKDSLMYSQAHGIHTVSTYLYFWWDCQTFLPIAKHWVLDMKFRLTTGATGDLTRVYKHSLNTL